jgi:hypothetical protein
MPSEQRGGSAIAVFRAVSRESTMEKLLLWVGRLAGLAGVSVVLVAVFARGRGSYLVAGLQVGTLLQAGIAAMVVACLAYLAYLAERPRT